MDLYLDIETCPDLREGALQRCIDAVEPPGNYKKPESIAEWKAANAEAIGREQWSRTALDPMRGGIYVICYSIDFDMKATLYREPGEPEGPWLAGALQKIHESVDKVGQPRSPRFIGWNIIGFDLPFIAKRCAIHGIAPRLWMPLGVRFNNDKVLDLMIAWSGFKDYAKQRDVAAAMGINLLDDTDGKDLWAAVERDGVGAAAKKCASDIDVLRQIHRRMAPVFRL
jgi:3'-5' exonuclease